jgi:sulfur-oxidizing protein SoxX
MKPRMKGFVQARPHRWIATWFTSACLSVWLAHGMLHAQTLTRPTEPTPSAAQVDAGFKIILDRQQGNCLTCHALSAANQPQHLPKALGLQGNFGPSLDGAGARHSQAVLLQWVTDARKIKLGTLMPPYGSLEGIHRPNAARPLLEPEQLQAVAAALSTLR